MSDLLQVPKDDDEDTDDDIDDKTEDDGDERDFDVHDFCALIILLGALVGIVMACIKCAGWMLR